MTLLRSARPGRWRGGLVLTALALGALVTGCKSGAVHTANAGAKKPVNPPPSVTVSGTSGGALDWRHSISLTAHDGRITSVAVTGPGRTVTGQLAADGGHWSSEGVLTPATTYTAHVALAGPGGAIAKDIAFHTTGDATQLTPTLTPGPDDVVGVGAPLVVTFNHSVRDRAAVERAMTVTTSNPVVGAWHWFSATEVHYRPREYWPANTSVHVALDLAGVYAGGDLWGDRDHDYSYRIGAAHVSVVDAAAHTFTVYENGRSVRSFPTSLGKPEFQTRTGVYQVLNKTPELEMTSCSASITCDKANPNYYDLKVDWDVRLTDSGTFVHAAPWSVGSQGEANVSHGCVNLSTDHGRWFYDFSQPGDVVQVINSPRAAWDLVREGDPGMVDWNISWSNWVAGSALPAPTASPSPSQSASATASGAAWHALPAR